MRFLSIVVTVLISSNAFGVPNNIILFGGGGEPIDEKNTQFDASMVALSKFYQKNNDYHTIVNFNGGHSDTELKIKSKFNGAEIRNNFSSQNYEKIIEDTLKQLENNEIPSGGKILVFIDSHGTEKKGQTHSISTAHSALKSMNGGGSSTVSLDKLKILADLVVVKNVNLAIVDGSCHSGNTLSLANSKTCVIAASGPLHYSYSTFTSNFAKKMRKGKNLEDIFLETSKKINGLGFPMISSPAGIIVQDEIYPYLTPYMYYHDEYRGMPLDKIDSYITDNSTPELLCKRNDDYNKLNSILSLVQQMSAVSAKNGETFRPVNLNKLKRKINNYKITQDEYLNKLNQLDLSTLQKFESVSTPDGKIRSKYSHREILTTNYTYFVEMKKQSLLDPFLSEKKRQQNLNMIEFYKVCMTTKERILLENPHYLSQEKIMNDLKNDDSFNRSIAFEIMDEANTVYNAYYKLKDQELNSLAERPASACKDFVL